MTIIKFVSDKNYLHQTCLTVVYKIQPNSVFYAVSYTHLDVYKRQGMDDMFKFLKALGFADFPITNKGSLWGPEAFDTKPP